MRLSTAIFCLLFGFLAPAVQAQFTYVLDQGIPVEHNQVVLPLAWAGGLNSPQINTMDLNGDHQEDLVLFDRTANKVITFLNVDHSYRYAPEYEALFPAEVDQWLLLRDFNCDGKKDIFTSDPFGMRAFVNTTPSGGKLSWRKFNPDFPILTIGFNGSINLQVNSTDIPAIEDIDGDGDLDILDARFVGIGSIEWHKNMSIENSGTCDSLQLKRVTQTWGNFEECNCGKYVFGPGTCSIFGGRTEHAAGKSILTLDLDNDGDRDLLFSEETCNNLYLLPNEGTPDSASITRFLEFPSNGAPVDLQLFPAAYNEDVDFDGLKDLVIASNVYTRNSFSLNFSQSVWLYKNTGTAELPSFTFKQNNFLQDLMIDLGDNTVPAFFDMDGDGDLDLFVGNYLGINAPAGIAYYENTGTRSAPSFKFITADFGNISFLGWFNLKPQFADLNGDGKKDLAFTATNLQSGITSLSFFPNQSNSRLDIDGQSQVSTGFTLNQPENVLITDVNQDGRMDLLLGKSTGALEFWRNAGGAGSFQFTLDNGSFLGLGTSTDRQSLGLAAADLDADGREDLIAVDQNGALSIFSGYKTNDPPGPVTNILYNSIMGEYQTTNLGGHAWPTVVNLFDTNKPMIVAGNTLGGLMVLKNDGSEQLGEDPVINIFPNPLARGEILSIRSDRNISVQILSVLGQRMSGEIFVPANESFPLVPQGLPSGMYIAQFSVGGKTYNRRFIIK